MDALNAAAAGSVASVESTESKIAPLSWVDLDPEYTNRSGYDADFLDVRVPLPRLSKSLQQQATESPLKYQHFTVLMSPARRLAFWTAVNIDGSQENRLGDRAADQWWLDSRAPKSSQTGDAFYKGSGFQRGHLVRRLDPAWGSDEEAGRGEADSFHWTNCSPQVPVLNTQWWLAVEEHVLQTANARDRKVSVFSGCLFTDDDPMYRKLRIPLAFWKVVAWVTAKKKGKPAELRSLGFMVKQDEAVAALIKKKGVEPLAVELEDVPSKIQGYQVTLAELQKLTGVNFGVLAGEDVDVYARARQNRIAPLAFNQVDAFRRLRSPSDLLTG